MNIGRKLYFDKLTGNVLLDTGERSGSVRETTREEDFQIYNVLAERVSETVGVMQLTYGHEREKFGQYACHIDVVTSEIVWDLTPIQQEEAIAKATLEEEVASLKQLAGITPPVANPLTLEDYRQNKIYEINRVCNQMILGGFLSSCTGLEHQYKFDMEYQGNFAQQGVMLSLDPAITTVLWPTSDAGVIPHTREQYIQLCKDAQAWKSTNTYRYFTMKAQIQAAGTIDLVNAFTW